MATIGARLSATPGIVAIQVDDESLSPNWRPPAALSRQQADELTQRIADDLESILGSLNRYGLILPAALYDATELLQPGLPKVEALMELYTASASRLNGEPAIIAIGCKNGEFPIPSLAPRRARGSGPLLAIPFVLLGTAESIDLLKETLDRMLFEEGDLGNSTKSFLERRFNLKIRRAAYATLGQLGSLFKIHLQNAGFGDLWHLLETALSHPEQSKRVSLPQGNVFILDNGVVYSPFYTINSWRDARPPVQANSEVEGYINWLRLQRQYTAALTAHGFRVQAVNSNAALAEHCMGSALAFAKNHPIGDETRITETLTEAETLDQASVIALTEHMFPDFGPIAYTVLIQSHSGELLYFGNEYPLSQSAIPKIIEQWEKTAQHKGIAFDVSRPGFVNFSNEDGILMPYLDMA